MLDGRVRGSRAYFSPKWKHRLQFGYFIHSSQQHAFEQDRGEAEVDDDAGDVHERGDEGG